MALAALTLAAAPASAQQELGERITILVPNLTPEEGVRDRFGQRVARDLRSAIEDLHTHQTVSDRELRAALRQFNMNERQLHECISARQLAMQMGWGLVVCGQYGNAGSGQVRVTASFVGAETGESFDVEPFVAAERDTRGAAHQILETFDVWQNQLRHTVFCSQYLDSEQWEQALSNCEQALAINPGSRSAAYMKALALRQLDRRDEALTTLEGILAVDPLHQDALKSAGILATEMQRRDEARNYFDRYMELNPDDIQVRLTVATDIANAGDPEGALRFAEQGLEAQPDNLQLITYLGHFATNAAVQAEARMSGGNGAGAVDPSRITSLYQTAARSYERVFNERGTETDPSILERLVIARFKLGQFEEAIELGQRAAEAQPENPSIWEAYARALDEAGRHGEALRAIDRVESLGRTSAALSQRKAMIQLRQGNTAAGVATLNAAVERQQLQRPDAYRIVFRHAYQDKFQRGQLDEAYRLLDQAGPLAVEEEDRLSRNFWRGYILFQQGQQAHEPMTAESARRAKPLFQRALELFQGARGYERLHPSADVPRLIDNTNRFIEIQDALIRRGR